jgi:stage III sporulation protein AE
MELDEIWQEYGLDKLEEGIRTFFPEKSISAQELFSKVLSGDLFGAAAELFTGSITDFLSSLSGLKNLFVWLLVMGILSALITFLADMFDSDQVANLGFYFFYLLFSAVLLSAFKEAAETAAEVLENLILFARLVLPAYLLTVGISGGSVTAGVSCEFLYLMIYGVENLLSKAMLPLVYSYVMLNIVNGIWGEEKLILLMDFLRKGIRWCLKGLLGIVAGFGFLQSMITPLADQLKKSGLEKLVSAIPGIGNAAEGVVEMVLASALMIKNSAGVIVLLLFLVLGAAPLAKIAVLAGIMKAAAAFMGIVSDRRLTGCVDRTGDAELLLFQLAGTALLLFMILVAVLVAAGG